MSVKSKSCKRSKLHFTGLCVLHAMQVLVASAGSYRKDFKGTLSGVMPKARELPIQTALVCIKGASRFPRSLTPNATMLSQNPVQVVSSLVFETQSTSGTGPSANASASRSDQTGANSSPALISDSYSVQLDVPSCSRTDLTSFTREQTPVD